MRPRFPFVEMPYPLKALEGVATKGINEKMTTRQNYYTALLWQNLCWWRSLPL